MFFLLALLGQGRDIHVEPRSLKFLHLELPPDENVSITANAGILAVIFFKRLNADIDISVNNNSFHVMDKDDKACGFDFGENDVEIKVLPREFGEITAALISWPDQCRRHRVITTLPFDTLVYSHKAPEADYRLTDSQTICIWSAQPSPHDLAVEMHTEHGFDVLEYRSNNGIHRAFSGNDSATVHSPKGLNYFVWRSDHQHISENFTIATKTSLQPVLPFFKKTIRVENDVSALFPWDGDTSDFYPDGKEPDWGANSELRELMPVFYGLTLIFVAFTIPVVAWCVHVAVCDREGDRKDPVDERYQCADGDIIPQPVCIETSPVDL